PGHWVSFSFGGFGEENSIARESRFGNAGGAISEARLAGNRPDTCTETSGYNSREIKLPVLQPESERTGMGWGREEPQPCGIHTRGDPGSAGRADYSAPTTPLGAGSCKKPELPNRASNSPNSRRGVSGLIQPLSRELS